ncbi:hypothetical protein DdX_22251 [Ditylenchus destructor]|uniref:Uncharacterized protein n=1 Tax=Ditylenchus destructor TaxID=166010 RepID=A0AAD4MHU1_9BILA|nr:hypothetical protein DdX_22251 [Ditylenchus destructor]
MENLHRVFPVDEYGYSSPNPHVILEMSGEAPSGLNFQLKARESVLVGPKAVTRGRWSFMHELEIGTGQKYVLVFQKGNDDKSKREIGIVFGSSKLADDKGVNITFWGWHMVGGNIHPMKDTDVRLENKKGGKQQVDIRTWASGTLSGLWSISRHISPQNEYLLSIAKDEISDITIKLH